MKQFQIQIWIACISGAISIILGAFSAHGLEKLVQQNIILERHIEIFEKAVRYQMYHSLLLVILAIFNILRNHIVFFKSYYIILFGIVLFSGSLYWISLQNIFMPFPHFLFWITPLGGILMIIGWFMIIYEFQKLIKNL
ncbi:MAG: UPF0382 membrane protein [Leptospiraceae bacterium]|nr:MAG: UPF0382 membrane protein [Leptospiraceae bacterium]